MIPVDQPQAQIRLVKRVAHITGQSDRFKGRQKNIDLTDFLGEGCSISTVKDLHQPAGCFTITIADQGDFRQTEGGRGVLDTVYGVVEPMDYVEIRIARHPQDYQTGLPVVMRGFVSDIARSETMQGDKPQRRVTITGRDYGKVPQIVRIMLRADYGSGFNQDTNNYLSTFRLFARTGSFGTLMKPKDFISDCVNSLLNPYLAKMAAYTETTKDVPQLTVDAAAIDGMVSPFAMQMFGGETGGSVWELMTTYADLPWNELFIEDREVGPVVVYRPCPYVGLDDKTRLMPGAPKLVTPQIVTINDTDIVSLESTRSDADVANFFWVQAPISTLNSITYLNIESLARGQIVITDSPNANPLLYGLRPMSAQSNQLDPRNNVLDRDADGQQKIKYSQRQLDWIAQRRDELKALNRDNVLLERGSLVAKGNENLKAGTYVRFQRGGFTWIAYLTQVSHHYQAFTGTYITRALFERSTNFLRRVQSVPSPYYVEGARGPYD